MKMFALIQIQGGSPNIDQATTPYSGFVLCDQAANWGAYLVSGTAGQLTAIAALPQVVGICQVSENGVTKWTELDNTVSNAVKNALNTWRDNNRPGWPTVTNAMTYRQIIQFLFNKFNARFDLNAIDIS